MTNSSPQLIKLRDLSHVHQLAGEDLLQSSSAAASRRSRGSAEAIAVKYEISAMPVTDIIEMVAGLLSKITATNDRPHEHLHHLLPPPEGTAILNQQTSSVLAFHGKNVPTISILSYLTRIHRYCPTTYEVFLGLLVYFDRMTERVNSGSSQTARRGSRGSGEGVEVTNGERGKSPPAAATSRSTASNSSRLPATRIPESSAPADPASAYISPPMAAEPSPSGDLSGSSQFFVVDSFNIHRLVIAGVTCASKFFSDVFYTNSRYAKVGVCYSFLLTNLIFDLLGWRATTGRA